MRKINLEQIPDLVIGRLLLKGWVIRSVNISHDLHSHLCLWLSLSLAPDERQAKLPLLLPAIGHSTAEFFADYPELKRLVIRAEAWSWHLPDQSRYFYISNEDLVDWKYNSRSDELLVASFREYESDPFRESLSRPWRSWV